jgi:hypothetical protein
MRVAAVVACLLLVSATSVRADPIDTAVEDLKADHGRRERLTAALALSKSKDARAIIALARALGEDNDRGVREVAARALEKNLDTKTAPDAIQFGVKALMAARSDGDGKVREIAGRAFVKHAPLLKKAQPPQVTPRPNSNMPPVFINVDNTIDQSKQMPADGGERLKRIVKSNVERANYATSWPGGTLPTSADLATHGSRAFIVASTVKKIEITKQGTQTEIACTVAVRVAPWSGRDGGERWEANRAASASGSAKATTSNGERAVQGGVRECLEAVAEDVTARQVVPFLRRVASTGI